jgi:peptidoglycan/xylan/chitin deacetylase (PgdA/CDA1 family)
MRFVSSANFATGEEFVTYLKDHLKYAVKEGRLGYSTMMNVGLHCRLSRAGRVAGLEEFIDFARSFPDVWITTREKIADFWYENHYPDVAKRPAI